MCRIKTTICSSIKCYASVCRYHENFMLLLDELHKVNKTIPTYSKEFIQSLVCNPESKLCWKNLCNKCRDTSLLDQYYVFSDWILSWFNWQNATLPNRKEKLQKLSFQGSFGDAFSELKLHSYILAASLCERKGISNIQNWPWFFRH